jgi:UDP-glucose 4-epimerase
MVEAENMPITENAPIQVAMSPYGNKANWRRNYYRYCKVTGISAILLRYFNPIGAHPSAAIGELPLGASKSSTVYYTNRYGFTKELAVYGTDYPTADGTAVRDYIHVVDLAKACDRFTTIVE